MPPHCELQTVKAYLRGNGVREGFIQVQLPYSLAEKTTFDVGTLSKRLTCTVVYGSMGTQAGEPVEIVVAYDARLHCDPPGIIRCPYFFLGRTVGEKKYVNLTIAYWNDIAAIIDE